MAKKKPVASDYILKAQKYIFRYESLQDYTAMDGDEFIREFIRTGVQPFRAKDTEWWQTIKGKNDAGVNTSRVRMVTEPLTDYTRWELAALREAAAFSGEEFRIISEAAAKKISPDLEDFYLMDDRLVAKLVYGPKGKWLKDVMVKGAEVKKYIEYRDKLIANSDFEC